MVNAKTRHQWKARLESTEALTSSARDGKGEAEVQQAQVPSVVMSKKKKLGSRKRKLGDVLEEQESAARDIVAIRKDVQDCTRGKSSSVHDGSSGAVLRANSGIGTTGSFVPEAPAHQRARRRGIYGASERTRGIEVGAPAENNISPDITGKEAVVYHEEKKGKGNVMAHNVRKHGKEKVGEVVSNRSIELNPNRKRINLLHGLAAVSEDMVNLAGPLTRGMAKPGTDGHAGTARMKKRRRFRPEGKAGAPIIAEGESAGAEVALLPGEEAAKWPNTDLPINGSNVESSNKTAGFDRVLGTKALAPLEIPADVLDLIHVPPQAEVQLSKPGRSQSNGKSISEVHLVRGNRDRLPKRTSPRVTRGMKDTISHPAGITNGSPHLKGDPESGIRIDEPLDQAIEPTTAVECASMQLRNRKMVGENLNSAERPRKRVKKKQDKLPADNCQKVVGMMKASDSMSKNRRANGTEGLGIINAATSDSQANHSARERNGNSSLNKEENNGGGAQLSFTERVHTNGSKMDCPSRTELQVDPGLLSTVSGLAVQCIKGGVEKKNDKDTCRSKDCTEGDGRKGGRLGRMKKREKKKIDPGGGESLQENKASDPHRNVLQHEETRKCKMTKESPQVGPGPAYESQPVLGKHGVDTQNLKGRISEAAEKSQKPVEFAEIRDKIGVEKYVHLAETDGGCPEIDHHHLASKTLLDESSSGEKNKLDTVAPRGGPSKPVRVLTRGRVADGMKSIGPANDCIRKKFKTKGNVGRLEKCRNEADSRALLQIPKSHVENRKVDLPTGDGKTPDQGEDCSCDREGQKKLPKELSAPKDCNTCRSKMSSSTIVAEDGSTFKDTSDEVNLTDSAYQHEVSADTVQSEHGEGQAEPLNVAVEVTQNSLQINAGLAFQFSEAQGGPESVQVPVKKKKVWRRRDYGCGIEFQRVTRARDSTGKSVSDFESQGSKNGTVADAVIGEHVEIRPEGVVFTTEKSEDSPRLEEINTEKEDLEQGKNLLDFSDLLDKSVCTYPKDDVAGATIEREKEAAKLIEALKSVVPESAGTGVLVVQETENSEVPTLIPSSVLKHFDESEAAVQEELNGERDDQPASSAVSLPYCQHKTIKVPELFSKLPDSPDGPFSLEDGKSLTLHCGQEEASNLDDGRLSLEVSHSLYFEKICAQDFDRSGAAHGAYSIRAPDKSESLTLVKTSDPVASVDKSDPVATVVKSELVGTMVESSPVVISVESDPLATIVGLDPVAGIVESDPVATRVESDPVAAIVESDPVASIVESDPVAAIVESDPVAAIGESDPVAAIVEIDPVAATVESDPIAAIVESDPVAATVESDPVAATVESDPVAAIVESDPVATTIVSDPVPFTVESDLVGLMVDSDPGATVVESDPFYSAEDVNPTTTSDSLNVDIQNSITIENMFDAIGEPECVAAVTVTVTDSDSVTTLVTTVVNSVSIATIVEDSSVPTYVVNKENSIKQLRLECTPSEIGPVKEFAEGSERTIGECLITGAVNSRQEQVTLDAPLEDFELRDDNSTESPRLEREGFQLTLRGKVADSIQQEQPTPVKDSVRQPTSEVEDSLAEAYASSERRTEEEDSTIEPESCKSLRGGHCVELVSSDCPQLDLTDEKCTKGSSDVVELDQFAADRIPQEGSGVPLLDNSLLNQVAESGVDLSGNGAQNSRYFAAGDLPVGTGQVVTSRSAKSIAVDRKEGSITPPTSRSILDDVTVDNELIEEKFPSTVEDLQQTKSDGQEADGPILKNVDVEPEDGIEVHDETKEENSEVREVHIKAYGSHTEVTEMHSKTREMLTDTVGLQSEAKQVNLNAEVDLAVGIVQAEVHDVQVEAQLVDGTEALDHISLSGDVESVIVDIECKQLETEAKEMHVGGIDVRSELDWRNEVDEVDAQQVVDAEANGTVALEVTNKNEHTTEGVSGLDNLGTTSTRQPPHSLVSGCDSSVAVAGQTMSVPEVDISRPLSSDSALDQQTGPINELTNSEPVTLDTEKYVQVDKQGVRTQLNQQDTVESVHLTSPVEASRCLEGDVLHPEELSDIQMETHEKDDSKTQTLRLEDAVSQRHMAGVKGSLVSKKRKGRTGMETTKEPESGVRAEDAPSRVYPKKRGFLLMSTTIESGGMRIRPRPLDPDQSILILVEGRDKEFHDYDGGSFYRWVQQQEEAKLKKPTMDPVADGLSEGGRFSIVCRPDLVKKCPIVIPLFRKLPDDKQTNGRILARLEQDVMLGIQSPYPRPQAYLRHTKPAARKLGHALGVSFCTVPSVYDMDDDDEEWLQAYNEILKHSGADLLLSESTFEQLMELFEREFYRICQINDKSLPVLPRNLGENAGASGRRGKRLVMDSSQRHSWLEANKDGAKYSKPEIFQGALSQKEIERRSALENRSDDCCICNGGENSDSNPIRRCQICSINVHESCYGICAAEGNVFGHHAESPNWRCRKCEAVVGGRALPSISCAICCKSGGAMKPTVDPLKWAHVACALYTNETFFIDTEAMEPVDGLAAVGTRVKKQRERCGLCGAREGSCVRCSTRGCRTPFHISCGVSQGASFELRHTKQQVEGIRSFCPHHATFVPGTNIDEIHHAPSKTDDAGEPVPAVSTESSDTLEMRHGERRNVGDESNGPEDAIMNGAGWQGSFSNKTKLHRSGYKIYFRKSRSGARPSVTSAGGATPSKLYPNSSRYEISEKDVHGVSRTLPRSGSMLKENMQGVSQYMDESDPYVHPSDAERLESEAVSAATSFSSSHLTTYENVDQAGKGTSNVDEVDPVVLAERDKSVTRNAYISDAISFKFPSLEALDTNLAPTPIVKAVYSFWQVKRVKSKGPILHELRQLQVARSQGIFNKVVHLSTDILPPVVPDSQARMPVTRRPRSLSRDPIFSRFSELRQQLEILRSIASNVVRREQVKLEDQKLIYESVQQQLLIAGEVPRSRRCLWCENNQSLLNCSSCPRAFCFQCFKHRRGYGVKGWIAASKLSKYVCNFCLGSIAQERGWPELSTTFSEPRGTAISRLAQVPGRDGDWNPGLEVRSKPNSGKQVSFFNETFSNPYGSSSSPQEAASTMAPGRGKMIYSGRPIDVRAVDSSFVVPCSNDRTAAVDRSYHGGVSSSGPNDPAGNESLVQLDHPHVAGKKVKKRRAKVNKQVEPNIVLRATKRIKKLARSSSYVYGSEDETTISENGESRNDKKTVKLSDLRDKDGESQCTNSLEVGAEDKAEKGHPPLKFGIKFSPTGKLIVRRHGPPQHP